MNLKILKRIFKKNNNKIKLKKFDIVYINMKILEIITKNISESHTQRPFLITKVRPRKVIGYYMTSNLDNTYFKNKKDLKLILNTNKYKLKKQSLILYNKKIKTPKKYIVHYIDKLKKDDIRKLKKYKKLIKKIK